MKPRTATTAKNNNKSNLQKHQLWRQQFLRNYYTDPLLHNTNVTNKESWLRSANNILQSEKRRGANLKSMQSQINTLLPILHSLEKNIQNIQRNQRNQQRAWEKKNRNQVLRSITSKSLANSIAHYPNNAKSWLRSPQDIVQSKAKLLKVKREMESVTQKMGTLGALPGPEGQAVRQTVIRASRLVRSAKMYTPQMEQLVRGLLALLLALGFIHTLTRIH